MDVITLTQRHPESVAEVFKAYGYQMPATPRNLQNLLLVHGDKPLPFSDATGTDGKKKTLKDWIQAIGKGVAAASGVLNKAKTATINARLPEPEGDEPNGQTPRILGISRELFTALAAITLLVLAVIIFKRK